MKRYLICPVRNRTPEQEHLLCKWVLSCEQAGDEIYFPSRDTEIEETPLNALPIWVKNLYKMIDSDIVDIWYEKSSQGSSTDIGMAFVLDKKINLPWRDDVIEAANGGDEHATALLQWGAIQFVRENKI